MLPLLKLALLIMMRPVGPKVRSSFVFVGECTTELEFGATTLIDLLKLNFWYESLERSQKV